MTDVRRTDEGAGEPRPATVSWLSGALTGALVMAVLLLLALLLFQA